MPFKTIGMGKAETHTELHNVFMNALDTLAAWEVERLEQIYRLVDFKWVVTHEQS